jgi:hypothetical protein
MTADGGGADWAVTELGQAALGDQRRTARLVALGRVLAQRPHLSLPQACGDSAQLKAAYRFFSNEAIAPEAIVASHVAATWERVAAVERVLAVQDTSELDWTAHPATRGLGTLTAPDHQGLLVHSTLAVTAERLPLGLLAQQTWTRPPEERGKAQTRRQRPTAEKESQKWLTSLAAVNAAKAHCPQTHLISVGDAEADIYDLFAAPRAAGVDLLVRAGQNRRLADGDLRAEERLLRTALAATEVATTVTVAVPRQADHPARQATVAVHWRPVTLRPPKARTAAEGLVPLALWAVWAHEVDAPPEVSEPLDWLLLTTVAVTTTEEALERLRWYTCRWGIEVFHKVLKSGCALERRQLEDADHLQRCLALFSVIAWHLLALTMLARVSPEVPCTAILEEDEWQALCCVIQHTPQPPTQPPTLAQAVRWIAQLGGFLGRKSDGPPGVTVLWRGMQRLADLTTMYQVFRPSQAAQLVGND